MTNKEVKKLAIEKVKAIINLLAAKDYKGLAKVTNISSSWIDEGKTSEDGCIEFGEWLDEQLDMWAEDEGKKFVIDTFEEDGIIYFSDDLDEDDKLFEDNIFRANYRATSHGEELDFWFEINIDVEKEESTFDVNF